MSNRAARRPLSRRALRFARAVAAAARASAASAALVEAAEDWYRSLLAAQYAAYAPPAGVRWL